MTNYKLHEDCKQLSQAVYQDEKPKNINGWQYKKSIYDSNGFYAEVYEKDGKVILAIRGTDTNKGFKEFAKDAKSDIQMSWSCLPSQAKSSEKAYIELIKKYGKNNVIITGHSLGGAISQYVSAVEWCKSVNFNPLGAREVLINNMEAYDISGITNYCNPRDMVAAGMADKQLGVCYEVPSKGFTSKKEAGLKAHHDIESMEDLSTRKLISREELKEKYNNYSHHGTEHHVNGYTRDDGTKVESYTRSCGSNHTHDVIH